MGVGSDTGAGVGLGVGAGVIGALQFWPHSVCDSQPALPSGHATHW